MNSVLVQKETLYLLRKSIRISFFISIALLLLISAHLKGKIPSDELFLWMTISILVLIIRFYFACSHNKNTSQIEVINHQLAIFRAGAFASGILWGWCGYYFPPQIDLASQIYISFMLAGLIAGASSSLAADHT